MVHVSPYFIVRSLPCLWKVACSFSSNWMTISPGSFPGSWSPCNHKTPWKVKTSQDYCATTNLSVKHFSKVTWSPLVNFNLNDFLDFCHFLSFAGLASWAWGYNLTLAVALPTHLLGLADHAWAHLVHFDFELKIKLKYWMLNYVPIIDAHPSSFASCTVLDIGASFTITGSAANVSCRCQFPCLESKLNFWRTDQYWHYKLTFPE